MPVRNRFDRLAKQLGEEALRPFGITVANDEISPETQHADLRHEPNPTRKGARKRLGLLGRIAGALCLIEIYGHVPSAEEFRACLAKHIAFWRQRSRRARADNKKRRKKRQHPQRFIPPFLWIITAGAPTALLKRLQLEHAPGWPAGVYLFGDSVLRVGIVVASKLPRDRSTILVRLMAAGALLPPALKELGLLPPKAYERSVAEPILLNWHSMLRQKPNRSTEEQEFIMAMYQTWEEARAEARAEGRAEARTETQAKAVLTALEVRGIAVPAAARKRILAEKDLKQLERWFKKAIVAKSLEEVLGRRRRAAPTTRRQHA